MKRKSGYYKAGRNTLSLHDMMDGTGKKVALVTGGAKRVGHAIVEQFASGGYDIAFTYLSSAQAAESFARQLQASGCRAVAIHADLTYPAAAAEIISTQFRSSFQRLDVLVNNASLFEPDDADAATIEQNRRLMGIHFESPMLLCQGFSEMLRQNRGHVVNMVDLLAEHPAGKYLAYCASKAALRNLTLGLARKLAPEVTVNGIAPGVVDWPTGFPAADRAEYLKRVPLGRPGTPQDVARLVYFLATTGSYMTGQILRLDGGRSIT